MTTRLNPITTPRHELRAENTRRNREAALAAFVARKAEFEEMLSRLQAHSDENFDCHPDEVGRAMVGTLEHYASLLRRTTKIRNPTNGSSPPTRSSPPSSASANGHTKPYGANFRFG